VTGVRDGAIRPRLEQALREALRERNAVAVSAVRSALAALDNAQAVPAAPATGASDSPHFAGAAAGLGAGEAERRRLGEAEARDIVRAEVAERQAAAREYDRRGLADQAARLRREATVLRAALEGAAHGTKPPQAPASPDRRP
jgi:uncharacterized protein YqeY